MSGRYRVIWKHRALTHDVADVVYRLMAAGEKVESVTSAMAKIEGLLTISPAECGESREAFERILFVEPLVIDFEIHEDENIVYVSRVCYSPKRPI